VILVPVTTNSMVCPAAGAYPGSAPTRPGSRAAQRRPTSRMCRPAPPQQRATAVPYRQPQRTAVCVPPAQPPAVSGFALPTLGIRSPAVTVRCDSPPNCALPLCARAGVVRRGVADAGPKLASGWAGGFDLSGHPAIGAWLDRVAAMPGHVPIHD